MSEPNTILGVQPPTWTWLSWLGERAWGLWATIKNWSATVKNWSVKDVVIAGLVVALVISAAFSLRLYLAKKNTTLIPALFPPEVCITDFYPPPPLTNFSTLQGRPLYVFGDSTVDVGNFNLTKFPYGMDLNNREPGRFSNALTSADYLALRLSTGIPKAYRGLTVDELIHKVNVNFATGGGCGILERTKPANPFLCTSLGQQIKLFRDAMLTIDAKPVFFFSAGASDYLNTFLIEKPDPTLFATEVTKELIKNMELLYKYGGRSFLISNIGPLGCIPNQRHMVATNMDKCDVFLNSAVSVFNARLETALDSFRENGDGSVILADKYELFLEIVAEPAKFGMEDVKSPCCGVWSEDKYYECKHQRLYCDRKMFLFFDGSHPSDEANRIFIDSCLSGTHCRERRSIKPL